MKAIVFAGCCAIAIGYYFLDRYVIEAHPSAPVCVDLNALATADGAYIDLPPLLFLHLVAFHADADGAQVPRAWPELPGEGIDGVDLCAYVKLHLFFTNPAHAFADGDLTYLSSLQLKSYVDYDATYPEAVARAEERRQLFFNVGHPVWARALPNEMAGLEVARIIEADILAHSHCDTDLVLQTSRAIFIPTCAPH